MVAYEYRFAEYVYEYEIDSYIFTHKVAKTP